MLVYFALGDAKVWRWGSEPTPGPNTNGFLSQWNIGFRFPDLATILMGVSLQARQCNEGFAITAIGSPEWGIIIY